MQKLENTLQCIFTKYYLNEYQLYDTDMNITDIDMSMFEIMEYCEVNEVINILIFVNESDILTLSLECQSSDDNLLVSLEKISIRTGKNL